MKTLTESITHEYFTAVRDGHVYIRKYKDENGEFVEGEGEWRLLMQDGLPQPPTTPTNNLDRAEFLLKV